MRNRLYNIIKESVKHALSEDIKKGDVFRMDVPERMARKILAQRYGVSPNDFKYDGFKTYTYVPAKRSAKKQEFLGRGENETHEDYVNRVRQMNKNFADAESDIEGEEWRPLSNTGRYFSGNTDYSKSHEISNMGRVRTIDYKDPMRSRISTGYNAPTRNARQFHLDTIDDSGNSFKTTPPIHTMVADAWLDKPEGNIEDYDVIHKDGDYHNNRADNLEYRLKRGNRGRNVAVENKIRQIVKESIKSVLNEDVFDDDIDSGIYDVGDGGQCRVEWDFVKRTEFSDPLRKWEAISEGEKYFKNENDAMMFFDKLKQKFKGCYALIFRVEKLINTLSDDRWEIVYDASNGRIE